VANLFAQTSVAVFLQADFACAPFAVCVQPVAKKQGQILGEFAVSKDASTFSATPTTRLATVVLAVLS
jgi:hypothetical protein